MKVFDRKLGADFFSSLPGSPGVYQVFNSDALLIYVGKAKNLRRRIGQYRNAKRTKKHKKMREIIREAAQIEYVICASVLEAELLETQLIQKHRPKLNVAGAFSFMYPMIGIQETEFQTLFCYTTQPTAFPDYQLYGAFRSRFRTLEAFFALRDLLKYVGHGVLKKDLTDKLGLGTLPKYSYRYGYRQLPREWVSSFQGFLEGNSKMALEELVLLLLENAGARRKSSEVQDLLRSLVRFWKHEALPLRKAIASCQFEGYPVMQEDRDPLFLKFRHEARGKLERR